MAGPFIAIDSFRITGLPELKRVLAELPDKIKKKALGSAVRKGAAIVKNAAVTGARALDDRDTPEAIWKNVAVQFSAKQSKKENGIVFRVGIRGGAKQYASTRENRRKGRIGGTYVVGGSKTNPGGDTFYWRFLEFGTSKIAARPFMTPALRDNVQQVTDVVARELSVELDKIVPRNRTIYL